MDTNSLMERKTIMSLFLGPMRTHIPGHRDLTNRSDVKALMPKEKVYIPLCTGNNTDYEVLVQEGDHVDAGTKLAVTKSGFEIPLFSSVSGTYKGIVKKPHSSLKPQNHMVIELSKEQKRIQSFEPMDWQSATREQMVEFMKHTGIIGQGGAGFPTYVKYTNLPPIDTMVINAVECEPYITADYKCIIDRPVSFIHGCRILQKMAGAPKVWIAIKDNHPDTIKVIEQEIAREGLGDIEVKPLASMYPMGSERSIVYYLFNKRIEKLPSEVGVVVSNSGTAILAAEAFEKGYAQAFKFCTMSGEALNYPTNVWVPIGMEVKEIIEQIGGLNGQLDSCKLIAGGPMMGKTMVSDMFVIDRINNAVVALPNVEVPSMTCMRCGNCSAYCPVGLQPVRIAAAVKSNDVAEMEKRGCLDCIECGLCTYVCPSKIQVTENVRRAKRTVLMKKNKK